VGNRIDYAKASPDGFKAFGVAYVYLRKSGLSEELIDLVYLRVSQINGCAYCIDMHSRDLLKLGVTVDKLVLVPVWRNAGACSATANASRLAGRELLRGSPKLAFPTPTMKSPPPNSATKNSPTSHMRSA
jgi:AhpD family alkylhydroperoxidase